MKLSGIVLALSLATASGALADDEAPKVAGTDVPVPKRVKFVAPEYPAEAQARGMRGIVILDVVIDAQGAVSKVDVTRSVPPFDEAAVAAVKQWVYEPTKLGGKPVPVRLTVPITFALKLPEMKREDGIPELRQGANPGIPASEAGGSHVVTAEVTIVGDGQVAEGQVTAGDSPWAEALLQAIRTWRFAPTPDGAPLRFKVKAEFVAAAEGKPARAAVELSGPRHLTAEEIPNPAAAPGPPQPADANVPVAPVAVPPPMPVPSPVASPAAPAGASAAPTTSPSPSATPAPPPVEVISAPPPPAAPAGPEGLGVSAVRDVKVEAGLPDLIRGRRPVVPPLARIAGTEGTVEVKFAVDSSGASSGVEAVGPEPLRTAALQAVQSWAFRRTRADRLYVVASFTFAGDQASATVTPAPQ